MLNQHSKTIEELKRLPMEEKIRLLSETDKDYLRGYIDRALTDVKLPKDQSA